MLLVGAIVLRMIHRPLEMHVASEILVEDAIVEIVLFNAQLEELLARRLDLGQIPDFVLIVRVVLKVDAVPPDHHLFHHLPDIASQPL